MNFFATNPNNKCAQPLSLSYLARFCINLILLRVPYVRMKNLQIILLYIIIIIVKVAKHVEERFSLALMEFRFDPPTLYLPFLIRSLAAMKTKLGSVKCGKAFARVMWGVSSRFWPYYKIVRVILSVVLFGGRRMSVLTLLLWLFYYSTTQPDQCYMATKSSSRSQPSTREKFLCTLALHRDRYTRWS